MLVLELAKGETAHVGDDVQVMFVRMSNNQARLGFSAPLEMHIWRAELGYKPQENRAAQCRELLKNLTLEVANGILDGEAFALAMEHLNDEKPPPAESATDMSDEELEDLFDREIDL